MRGLNRPPLKMIKVYLILKPCFGKKPGETIEMEEKDARGFQNKLREIKEFEATYNKMVKKKDVKTK